MFPPNKFFRFSMFTHFHAWHIKHTDCGKESFFTKYEVENALIRADPGMQGSKIIKHSDGPACLRKHNTNCRMITPFIKKQSGHWQRLESIFHKNRFSHFIRKKTRPSTEFYEISITLYPNTAKSAFLFASSFSVGIILKIWQHWTIQLLHRCNNN